MVNGMLTLAKADRGDEIPKEPLSLAQIVSEVTQNAAPRAAEKQIDARASATPARRSSTGTRACCASSSATLVDNAIKFSERGRVDVARRRRPGSRPGSTLPTPARAFPKSELAHVFERFYRADKARSRERSRARAWA